MLAVCLGVFAIVCGRCGLFVWYWLLWDCCKLGWVWCLVSGLCEVWFVLIVFDWRWVLVVMHFSVFGCGVVVGVFYC